MIWASFFFDFSFHPQQDFFGKGYDVVDLIIRGPSKEAHLGSWGAEVGSHLHAVFLIDEDVWYLLCNRCESTSSPTRNQSGEGEVYARHRFDNARSLDSASSLFVSASFL